MGHSCGRGRLGFLDAMGMGRLGLDLRIVVMIRVVAWWRYLLVIVVLLGNLVLCDTRALVVCFNFGTLGE